ncbi:MAG: WecB/TagA/CpsF family glycosyltransferase [Candidatus Dormibacteria bacterium]
MPRAALVPPAASPPRLELLGVPVDRCTRSEALSRCRQALRGSGPGLQVVTLNPEMVMEARRQPRLAAVIRAAGLVLADGAGVVWASRRLRAPVPERITGADFLVELAELSGELGGGTFLLGGAPGVAETAAGRLVRARPRARVAGTWAGSADPGEAAEICQRIRSSGALVLAVAFGVPAQDLWLAENLGRSGARVGIGVGGTLDYLAGQVPRAPRALRRLGLEWAFRLVRQPWRLPRMARGAPFFFEAWRYSRERPRQ